MKFATTDGEMTAELQISDARLEPAANKVLAGERLNAEDGLALYQSHDLLAVGWLANYVREKRHGNICYFNVNRHINPTNVCVAHCRLAPLAARRMRRAHTHLRSMKSGSALREALRKAPRNSTSSAGCIPICRSSIT